MENKKTVVFDFDGVIHWIANAPKVKYLTELICKLGGCV